MNGLHLNKHRRPVSSLNLDELIETEFPKQHEHLSHKVEASTISKSTLYVPITKGKGTNVV